MGSSPRNHRRPGSPAGYDYDERDEFPADPSRPLPLRQTPVSRGRLGLGRRVDTGEYPLIEPDDRYEDDFSPRSRSRSDARDYLPARPEPDFPTIRAVAAPVAPEQEQWLPEVSSGYQPTTFVRGEVIRDVMHEEPRRRGNAKRLIVFAAVLAIAAGGIAGTVGGYFINTGGNLAPVSLPRFDTPGVAAGNGPNSTNAAAIVLPSVVSIQVNGAGGGGTGSGFVLDGRGHVLTNNHVVDGASQVLLVLSNGQQLRANVIGTDPVADIAVVRATGLGVLRPVTLGRSAQLRVGEPVVAIGSPLGLSGTVTAGIVSAVNRQANLGNSGRPQTTIQTDAPINPGNSGGPLVNSAGQVVGVNTAIATVGSDRNTGSIGIGFAIPIDRAAAVAERIIASGR